MRHLQYTALIVVVPSFLLHWPTIPTLVTFPMLVGLYVHLAHSEEAEARAQFGEAYDRYAAATPAFPPSWRTQVREPPSER
jgi:protein-S-isoprenylcysteine O-methyltransferase Ste14